MEKPLLTLAALAAWTLAAIALPLGCAGTAETHGPGAEDSAAAIELDAFFLRFRQEIQAGSADSLIPGLSRESLYKALSGERSPSFDTILKVVHALGLSLHAEPTRT